MNKKGKKGGKEGDQAACMAGRPVAAHPAAAAGCLAVETTPWDEL